MLIMPNDDPLAKLVVNTDELDRNKLSELLTGYFIISHEGNIRPDTDFRLLDTPSKLLATLLAQKAAKALGKVQSDKLSPKQIELMSGIPGGTVRRELRELYQQRFLDNDNGSYSVPNYAILRITLNRGEHVKNLSGTKQNRVKGQRTKPNSEALDKLLSLDQAKIGEQRLSLLLLPGRYLEKSLLVLTLARELGIDSLSPNEITQFLKEKIRVLIKRENISLALGRGIRYVDRFPNNQSGGFNYRIMAAGDKMLEEALASIK